MRARRGALFVGITVLTLAACAKKREASDVAALCDHMLVRLRGWDGRLDDPQLDCPRLQRLAQEAVTFTKAIHQEALNKGGQGEALSLVVDLESSTQAWAADVSKCVVTEDLAANAALVKVTHDKVRAAVAADRDRVQGRCGGRAGAK